MAIPQFTAYPSRDDPDNLEADTDTFFNEWPAIIDAMNVALATMDAATSGGALSLPYTFSTSTTDADPGNGQARFNNADLSLATVMRLDLVDAQGLDMTSILDSLDDSTSAVKAQVRIVKTSDVTKWASFNVLSMATVSGYRNFTVQYIGGSGAAPFAAADTVVAFFSRTGDKGETATNTEFVPEPVAASTINCALGKNYFKKTVNGSTTFVFTNIPLGFSFTLELAVVSGTVAFPATVRAPNGLMPTLTAGKTHLVMLVTSDGGANWLLTAGTNYATV